MLSSLCEVREKYPSGEPPATITLGVDKGMLDEQTTGPRDRGS